MKFCDYMAGAYPILNKDLLFTAAICHDIGKTKELSSFPENDYTDEGQLLGHIVIGVEMIGDAVRNIPDFPEKLANELKHCIVAHHGELEYGSPKKPALVEAVALNLADNTDDINNFAVTSKNAFKNVEYEANLFAVSLLFNESDFNMKVLNMSNYLLKQVLDYNIAVEE